MTNVFVSIIETVSSETTFQRSSAWDEYEVDVRLEVSIGDAWKTRAYLSVQPHPIP